MTRRSDSIAVVITEPTGRLFSDPFFPRLVRGVAGELAARDLQLVLLMPEPSDELRTARYLTGGHVDGALLVSLHGDDPIPAALAASGVPVVFVGRPPQGADVSYVDVDNRHGARRATTHLLERGGRRVATIAGPEDMAAGVDRFDGWRDAIRAHGDDIDPALVARGDFTHEGGGRGHGAPARVRARLRRRVRGLRPDGRRRAGRPRHAAAAASRRTCASPRFDDSPIAAATRPALTSVRQPIEELGREGIHLLLDTIERTGRPPRRVVLATELVTRASSTGRGRG